MTKKHRIRIISALISLSLMGVIFFFSAQPGSASDEVSLSVTGLFFSGDLIAFFNAIVRKVAHMAEYAALSLPVYYFISTFDMKKWLKYILPFLITVLYAASDEIHQLFIPGRAGKITDVFIDSVGAVLGILFIILLNIITEKIRNKKSLKNAKGD